MMDIDDQLHIAQLYNIQIHLWYSNKYFQYNRYFIKYMEIENAIVIYIVLKQKFNTGIYTDW